MTTQFKNVNGHIEVYDSTGEFLFSADTMEERGANCARNADKRRLHMYTITKM